jgi:hypothetical protein
MEVNMDRKQVIAFIACAAFGAGITWQRDVDAKERRIAVDACFVGANDIGDIGNLPQSGLRNWGLNFAEVQCPIPEDSYFDKTDMWWVYVLGEDKSNVDFVATAACISYWGITGGGCGNQATTTNGGTGIYELLPSASLWTSVSDFAYVYVKLPAKVSSSISTVQVVRVSD